MKDTMTFKAGEKHHTLLHGCDYTLIHIVNVIDEGLTFCPMVVYRYYNVGKQAWKYLVESAFMLSGHIEIAEADKDFYKSNKVEPAGFKKTEAL